MSRRLGAGRWVRRAGARQQAWQQALGRAGTARVCADGRAGRTRRGARQARHGRAGARGRQGMDARGRAAGACAWGRRAGGRARQERAAGRSGAREAHGVGARGAWPRRAWARLVHWLGQFRAHAASLGFDLGF